ncbi:KxYKxGKxW signal peptide domain-containing protein, partial [Streptococcus gallolyticus]|nr:KxYKxGKxW signal peptide domain-containing protein [Streptococcus gallolyticus]
MSHKEKNQGRFRMWKSGKQWLFSGTIILLIGVGAVVGGSSLATKSNSEIAEKSRMTYQDNSQSESSLPRRIESKKSAQKDDKDSKLRLTGEHANNSLRLGGSLDKELPGSQGERPENDPRLG